MYRPFRCRNAVAPAMSATTSTIVLAAFVGSAQFWPAAAERPEMSFTEGRLEARAEEESALIDVTDAASGSAAAPAPSDLESSGDCESHFGPLSEKMTIIDLDPDVGCVKGVDPQTSVVHFAGGSDVTCRPPTLGNGCHRFIVSRYADDCDLSVLEGTVGQEVSFTNPSTKTASKFDKDGVFTQCKEAALLQTRTLLYIGSGSDTEIKCSEDFCGVILDNDPVSLASDTSNDNDDKSIATRAASFWACYLLATACATGAF